MAPTRRQSNGRSPLVNQQRQITSFFSKSHIPSNQNNPTKSPNLNKHSPNRNPSPSPTPNPNSPSPSTPSPVQSKLKKPLLVIGASTLSPTPASVKSYGGEVVGKRIKVYWPLDKSWYQGFVKSFDKDAGKHLVQYDDAEEEMLNLENENIEWVPESVKKFKRLRRGSSFGFDKAENENEVDNIKDEDDESNGDSGGDDSSDEDWGMKGEKETIDDCEDEEEDMDLDDDNDDDDDEEEVQAMKSKGKQGGKGESMKRKMSGQGKAGSAKKLKGGGEGVSKDASKVSFIEPKSSAESK